MFDIREYLESRDIEYWTSGKNVTAGWTNIQCIFPQCPDQSNHLGINPIGMAFNCYICGESGFITKLIQQIDKCSWRQANNIYQSFLKEDEIPERKEHPLVKKIIYPKSFTKNIPKKAENYLKKRKFDPGYIITKYNLSYGGLTGQYKFRLIIPFYLDNKMVTFSSLDITGKQKPKYKHLGIEKSIIDPSKTLYNFDTVKDKMILVEGVTDVWRIGDGCCALTGKIMTYEQKLLIHRKKINSILVLLDSDAMVEAGKLATQLSGLVPHVDYIEYKTEKDIDPDTLPDNILKSLIKKFF